MSKNQHVIVVGGGAAGIMAAGQAALSGAKVTLMEKKERLARKIAISGKGRCNLTNEAPIEDFIEHYPGNGKFLYGILREFDNRRLRQFMEEYGVPTKVERGGRVFPVSDEAETIVDALISFLHFAQVDVKTGLQVEEVLLENGAVAGVKVQGGRRYSGDAVILCPGGASYPGTGSTGDGFRFAEALGHHVITPRPALIPLTVRETWVKEVQGLALRNVEVSLRYGGKRQIALFGEMLFTHFGVSGPVVLSLSRWAGDALRRGEKVEMEINLKPALSEEQLDARLQRDFQNVSNKHFKNGFDELLPKSLIPVIVKLSRIDPEKPIHQVTREERKRIMQLLTALPLHVTGTLPIEAAIVTAGGVDVKEIDPKTMASKLIKGLYWGGEVVDVDGVTGGYNLQAAFAMGYRAGRAAASFIIEE